MHLSLVEFALVVTSCLAIYCAIHAMFLAAQVRELRDERDAADDTLAARIRDHRVELGSVTHDLRVAQREIARLQQLRHDDRTLQAALAFQVTAAATGDAA